MLNFICKVSSLDLGPSSNQTPIYLKSIDFKGGTVILNLTMCFHIKRSRGNFISSGNDIQSHDKLSNMFLRLHLLPPLCWRIVGLTSHHCSPALEERSTRGCWGVIDMLCTEEVMGPSGSCCTIQSDCLVGQRTPGKISADEDSDLGKSCYCMCL